MTVTARRTVETPIPTRVGYGALLRTPGAWTFLVPAFAARLPYAMLSLGIVLLVFDTHGSYGTAGAVAAVSAVSQAFVGPQTGRLADRYGQAAVLLPSVALHALSVGALIALALGHAPVWTLFLAAAPAGASVPQIGAMVRARWVGKLSADSPKTLNTAFAFESVTDEFTFVVGPVLATAIATGVSPSAGLIAEAALTVVGGLAFAAQRRTAPARHPRVPGARRVSALASPGVRLLAGSFLGVGTVFGAMQVSVTAFAEAAGQPGVSGTVYGIFAGGSMLAGVLYGMVAWRRSARQRMLGSYALLVLGCSTLWAMPNLTALAVAGLVCGLAIAPTLITGYTLVETLVADGAKTEAFTWLTGAIGLGLAAGSTAAGQLIDGYGASAGFVVPVAGAGLGLAALVSLRRLLVAPSTPSRTVARSSASPALAGVGKG
ncbi:MFS transporter [Kitasatospora atroaurantiaca]|uniref:Putative MFS family arabinose efflux permease n=1 Tax=Kitasatospora atroaurantiaca TaxID=285545 RepID=A0A561EU54_9ACTN|nr:MFS transporter [Kitasatospora atroaurantiaca]TWE19135.1 putative MFS family arabinose efflux permease [Kitasatospora atroaurantiaca]